MSEHRILLACVAISASVCLAQPAAPAIGIIREPGGLVRLIEGVSGSFYTGAEIAQNSNNFACFGTRAVIIEQSSLVVLKSGGQQIRSEAADTHRAVAGFSGESPVVWLPRESRAVILGDHDTRSVPISLPPAVAEVLSISGWAGNIEVAAWLDEQIQLLSFDASTGDLRNSESTGIDSREILLVSDGRILWTRGASVYQRRTDGLREDFAAGVELRSLRSAGRNWIQASTDDGRTFLIKLGMKAQMPMEVFEVPASPVPEDVP